MEVELNHFSEWDFIERFHPNYNCNEIAWIDDIDKVLDGENEPGDCATRYYGNYTEEELHEDRNRLMREVLQEAFDNYLDKYYPA